MRVLLFFALLFSLFNKGFAQGSLEDDRVALVALYNSTHGENWINKSGWKVPGTVGDSPCGWFGITCGGSRVIEIVLNNNNLSGTLPAQITNLTALTNLNLINNKLSGAIPDISGISIAANVAIEYNAFTFDGMDTNISRLDTYIPQDSIPLDSMKAFPLPYIISVNAGAKPQPYPVFYDRNYIYKFFENDVLIATSEGDARSFVGYNAYYRVEVTHKLIPGLTLYSRELYLPIYALPVKLISFTAKNEKQNNKLTWSTTSEVNNAGFEIEKSVDGVSFKKIGFVDGAVDSELLKTYTFVDTHPLLITYYRLKQIDQDGKSEFSRIISVEGYQTPLQIFPNPASGHVVVKDSQKDKNVVIRDLKGRIVLKDRLSSDQTVNTTHLSTGTYLLTVGEQTSRIVIQK